MIWSQEAQEGQLQLVLHVQVRCDLSVPRRFPVRRLTGQSIGLVAHRKQILKLTVRSTASLVALSSPVRPCGTFSNLGRRPFPSTTSPLRWSRRLCAGDFRADDRSDPPSLSRAARVYLPSSLFASCLLLPSILLAPGTVLLTHHTLFLSSAYPSYTPRNRPSVRQLATRDLDTRPVNDSRSQKEGQKRA